MRLLDLMVDLIYPPKCAFCHKNVKDGTVRICEDCERKLPYTRNFGRKKIEFVSQCVAPLYYEDDVRESLRRFKFESCSGYAKAYAPMVADCIRQTILDRFDVLSWIPVSRERLRQRGYDQAELLAKAVAKELGLQAEPVLRKKRNTPPQSQTGSAEKRRANIAGAYAVLKPERVQGKRILLLDDIVTTGSTVRECAKALGLAGAEEVLCAAVARKRE